jgi:hypothetical protein
MNTLNGVSDSANIPLSSSTTNLTGDSTSHSFVILDNEALYDKTISGDAFRLIGILKNHVHLKGYCFATNDYLKKIIGWSIDKIKRLINSLIKSGYVKRVLSNQNRTRKIYLNEGGKNHTTGGVDMHGGGCKNAPHRKTYLERLISDNNNKGKIDFEKKEVETDALPPKPVNDKIKVMTPKKTDDSPVTPKPQSVEGSKGGAVRKYDWEGDIAKDPVGMRCMIDVVSSNGMHTGTRKAYVINLGAFIKHYDPDMFMALKRDHPSDKLPGLAIGFLTKNRTDLKSSPEALIKHFDNHAQACKRFQYNSLDKTKQPKPENDNPYRLSGRGNYKK